MKKNIGICMSVVFTPFGIIFLELIKSARKKDFRRFSHLLTFSIPFYFIQASFPVVLLPADIAIMLLVNFMIFRLLILGYNDVDFDVGKYKWIVVALGGMLLLFGRTSFFWSRFNSLYGL